uniref:Uncharacterized protein n=1 Tax=Parascaris equorum TaxID=6256 RepID=A0A914RBJ2_PAREQ
MSRAGYKGKYGDFEVPDEIIQQLNALYMQVTVGDYGENILHTYFLGKSRIECQREFIKLTNKAITTYGWNPPEGWQ